MSQNTLKNIFWQDNARFLSKANSNTIHINFLLKRYLETLPLLSKKFHKNDNYSIVLGANIVLFFALSLAKLYFFFAFQLLTLLRLCVIQSYFLLLYHRIFNLPLLTYLLTYLLIWVSKSVDCICTISSLKIAGPGKSENPVFPAKNTRFSTIHIPDI